MSRLGYVLLIPLITITHVCYVLSDTYQDLSTFKKTVAKISNLPINRYIPF